MFPTIVRRAAAASKEKIVPFNPHTNPYKAKKEWPPDFSKLSPKYQFRLERRYRRRMKMKWARPGWTKAVKIASWASCLSVLAYGIFFMDYGRAIGQESTPPPFQKARDWYMTVADSIWTHSTHQDRLKTAPPRQVETQTPSKPYVER